MITQEGVPATRSRTKAPHKRVVQATLAKPTEPRLVFQPIVDLRRGVVAGYEALARFSSEPPLPPDRWFAAAAQAGLAAEVEARVLRAALAARDTMPERRFLTVNVMPHLLTVPEVREVWEGADLGQLVFELNEAQNVEAAVDLTATIQKLRARKAFVAMDDVGSGYAGLRQLARVRPDFVKLDGSLVTNIDDDQVKITITELVGSFASRLNGWVIAEGVERHAELATLVSLGVPLGQGFLLGRPAPDWQELDPGVAKRIRDQAAESDRVAVIVSLMEPVRVRMGDGTPCGSTQGCPPCTPDPPETEAGHAAGAGSGEGGPPACATGAPGGSASPDGTATIIVSNRCRPVALWLPAAGDGNGDGRRVPTSMFALPKEPVTVVARRAMTRPRGSRFDPVIIVTEMGRPLGLVRMERLMLRLAEMSGA
jgi:EAL domain-containing protein (putative c-di-GMP-specific phosphodiesterase class I)